MNDLDLRTALHRDADLVGSPSPDLLDQLVQRRRRQRRQRAGILSAVAAVVVIAAGIPVGQSLLSSSDTSPAGETTVAPTPSVAPEVAATPSVTPDVLPTPTAEAPAVSVPSPADVTPPCPDLDTLQAALPPDTPDLWYRIFRGEEPLCSGPWAAAGYSRITPDTPDGEAGLWRNVDGAWTFHFRGEYCDVVTLPIAVYQRACMVD